MSKFRVLFQPLLGSEAEPFYSETVRSYDLAETIMNNIATYTLYLHDRDLMDDYSNYGIIQQEVDGEWIDFD